MIEIRADGCLVRVAGVVGYQHENNRAQIRFPLDDVLDIVTENPGGSYAVVYKRMFDEQFFTSTDYELDGAYLIWNVSSHVVAVRGDLEVQIVYSTDQQIAETQIYHFKVARGLMEDEEGQGENLSDLIEQALLAAGTVDQAIYDAQQTLDEKVTAAQTAQTAAEAAQTAAERAQHTAENAKTSAAQSANAAYNFAADANTAKRDATNAKDAAVQAKGAAETAKTAAETAQAAADADALKAEGYAVGTQNGTPAAEGQPYYQDNAKYYKEQAEAAKTAAEAARDTAQQTVAGIEAAGTAQVGRVAAEGATQVGNVQNKGQQVLDSIPDDYSELSNDVTNLKSAIDNSVKIMPLGAAWAVGTINTTGGAAQASNTRIHSAMFSGVFSALVVNSGYKVEIAGYDGKTYIGMWDGSSFVKSAQYFTGKIPWVLPVSYNYRLVIGRTDDGNMSVDEYDNALLVFNTDLSLSTLNKGADAKIVGDILRGEVNIGTDASKWLRRTIVTTNTGDPIGTSGYYYQSSTTRIAQKPPYDISKCTSIKVTPSAGYKFLLSFFDAELTRRTYSSDWVSEETTYDIRTDSYQDYAYCTMMIAKDDDTSITVDDYDKVQFVGTFVDGRIVKLENDVSEVDAKIDSEIAILDDSVDYVKGRLTAFNDSARIQTLIESGNLVPLDQYELLEYVEANSGNSYHVRVNTGLYLGPTLRTELDAEFTDLTGSVYNAMGREAVSGKNIRNIIGIGTEDPSKFYFGFGDENLYLGTSDTKRHLFFIDVPALKYGYDNIIENKTAFTYGGTYTENQLYLFGRCSSTAIDARAKVYSAKYYDDGTLVAYFVPVMRLSDNVAGFYDVVRQAFYTCGDDGILIAGRKNTTASDEGLPISKTDITDAYAAKFQSTGDVDGYLFVTDPHIYNKNVTEEIQNSLFTSLMKAFSSTPTQFVLSGGDWLQGGAQDIIPDGPTEAQACSQIGYVTGVMNHLFKAYYPIFGNHDGNYKNTAIPRATVRNLMFPDQEKCYYQFKVGGIRYYVFDTTTDLGLGNRTDYKREQQNWFVDQLLENTDDANIVICCHIFVNGSSHAVPIQIQDTFETASAFNQRDSAFQLPWDTSQVKDFSSATGKVRYCIAGHLHADLFGQYAGIPAIVTTNALYNHLTPSFDLIAYDYDTHILYADRIGHGANRIMHCDQVDVSTTETVTPTVTGTLTWASDNEEVATVSEGTVTKVANGYATISATNENGEAEAWVVHCAGQV